MEKTVTKIEKGLLNYVEKHLDTVILICVTLAGILVRVSLRGFISGDAKYDLLPWYEQIKSMGGIFGLDTQVGNYNMLYQFLIALMTYLPIKSLYVYKILSCIFDYLLAMVIAYLVHLLGGANNRWSRHTPL